MSEQDIFVVWPQFLNEILVYLGRPAVQIQLIGVAVALILGNRLGRWLQPLWQMRFKEQLAEGGFVQRFIYHLFSQYLS